MAFPSILGSHLVSHRATQWEQLLRWISDGWMFQVMYFTLFCVNVKLFQTWQGSSPPPVRGTVPEGSSRWQHRLLQKGRTVSKKNPSTYMLFLILLRLSRPPTLECKRNMPGHANKENNFSVWRWHIILNIIIIKIAKICNCCAELLQSCPTLRCCGLLTHQAPLSLGFSRQEHWSGLPCPPPGDLTSPGVGPKSP